MIYAISLALLFSMCKSSIVVTDKTTKTVKKKDGTPKTAKRKFFVIKKKESKEGKKKWFTIVKKSSKTTKEELPSSANIKGLTAVELRNGLIDEAAKYKGIKYKYAGRSPKGFDCSGFTSYVCSKLDIKISPSSSYQSTEGVKIPLRKAMAGDLVFFGRHGKKGKIQHVGMVYKNNKEGLYMIHSSSSKGITITNVTKSRYWKNKLLYARQVVQLQG